MKRIFCPALCAVLAFSTSTALLFAQSPSPQGSPDGQPPEHRGPPPSPLFKALDANHDGIISADEIANAPTVLKALAGPSGQLTRESLRPARREDDRQGDNRRDDNRRPRPDDSQGPGPQHENRRHQGPPPPPDGQDSPAASPDGQDGPPRPHHRPEDRRDGPRPDRDGPRPDRERDQQRPGAAPSPGAAPNASSDAKPAPGQDEPRHRPPHGDGLFDALDTNHDGVISADEITAAATSLKKADTNGDGQIDREDHRPPPPQPGQND